MSNINKQVGERIRKYRKANHMTIQNLADSIYKSKATVSKYEKGDITIDIQTLYDISKVLDVHIHQLINDEQNYKTESIVSNRGGSPFFEANRLYFYFYDGRYKRLKDGIIDISFSDNQPGVYNASLTINSFSAFGKRNATYYNGKVVYSDILIRFSFVNTFNALEEDLLYIFNPLEMRDYTEGLLCGISSSDFMPCAFKCLVTLNPQELNDDLLDKLIITKQELQRWQQMNMLIVGNT